MHVYIYDSFLIQKKYESTLAKIETRITDLGLSGKIVRLGMMNSIHSTIENELKKNAKTIVVVGNIQILNQATSAMANFMRTHNLSLKTPLGFIPVGKKNNTIAEILGLPFGEMACDVLSKRRIQTFDLGLANQEYFLTEAKISTENTNIEIDTNYSIEITEVGEIVVTNLSTDLNLTDENTPKINDNVLELFIKTKAKKSFVKSSKKENSMFSFKKLLIKNDKAGVILDESITLPCPVLISIAKEKINFIVGKERLF